MSLRVAITRALPEALKTAERIRALGHQPVLAPLLTIEPRPFDANIDGAQALLFTSAAGVRAFVGASSVRSAPVLTVGEVTAQAARDAGFADVRSADGDVEALTALAKATLDPAAGKLIHISGAQVAGDLTAQLAAAGFDMERRIAYDARAAAALPAEFAEKLDIVLFHSPRGGAAFVALGAPGAARLMAACLSPAVADAASAQGRLAWARLIVAPAPREDALLRAALTGANA